jgi:ribosomal protein L21E
MPNKFKKGDRVRGKPHTEYEGKTGTIKQVVSQWLDARSQRLTEEPKDAMKYFVLWDGEKETTVV